MKAIALFDSCWDGHHPTYFRFFTRTLLELGYQVVAFCPEPKKLHEWVSSHCPNQIEQFYTFTAQEPEIPSTSLFDTSFYSISPLRRVITTLAYWKYAAEALQNASLKIGFTPDLVFFPWIDSYLSPLLTHHLVNKIFPYNWSGLYFRPLHLRVKQRLSFVRLGPLNPDAVLKSSYCRSIALLDEGVADKLQNKLNKKPVVVFPDFADQSPPDTNYSIIQQIREKAKGRKIIGSLGSQSKRKGILTLLKVAEQSIAEDWFFIFVGSLTEYAFLPEELMQIRHLAQSPPHNCFFHFQHIPDEAQFNALVKECDVLSVVYENFPYSSNMLAKAAIFKKMVIASENFCIGERVRKFRLGLTIAESNVRQYVEALRCLFNLKKANFHLIKPDFEGYCHLHSLEQVTLSFQKILAAI
ncbi:glycosyl transferase [Scytonema hofmannii PCC 7110]|uniref:Glycosyl transferase n=1 Tax=Scytonema hofmannii PCC 7110 TaxID=128403 RepID=A0A139XA99_9CYAN|nr:glycosyltransferase [Scytonema hofmannii]KYC41562.1 glycosyl transferase [Scytonema hofmannii PCC 7110]